MQLVEVYDLRSIDANVNCIVAAISASDAIIAKAARVPTMAQIARIETVLRSFLLAKWNLLAEAATKKAASMASQGVKSDAIEKVIADIMRKWSKQVIDRFDLDIARVYRLSRIAAWNKVKTRKGSLTYDIEVAKASVAEPKFDVQDKQALEIIAEDHVFWIGDHYDTAVRSAIKEVVRDTILEAGQDRARAGEKMAKRVLEELDRVSIPKGYSGTARGYFEGLTANAATVARSYGNMRSFKQGLIERYEINNPEDDRTCQVCSHMDGKVFTVQQGENQIGREMKRKGDPKEHMKKVHPWVSMKALRGISSKAGNVSDRDSAGLAKAGLALPPYHFRCRCGVDISTEIDSWGVDEGD
jgi:hypothetical protein